MFSKGILYAKTCRACICLEKLKRCFIQQKNVNTLSAITGVSNKQIEYNQQKTSHKSENNYKKYMKRFLHYSSISAGIYVILSLRKKDNIEFNNWIPSVSAASPLHKPNVDNFINQEESTSTKRNIRKSYNFIADAAEKVCDGVVLITVNDPRQSEFTGHSRVVSNGSGFIIESDGLIMTNAHVVGNKPRASKIIVKLADGREYEGVIEELDAMSDLALVRINCKDLQSINLGLSKDLRAGEFVVAMGSPLSLSNSITSGVVSCVERKSKELGLGGPEIQYIQTDAAITFGNSGGPLINLDGEVIGINSMKVAAGISFAIPIDYAKEFLLKAKSKREFLSKRKTGESATKRRRYLGVTMFSLRPETIFELQRNPDFPHKIPFHVTYGILVSKVVSGSPAYYAGLSTGDIITHINGTEMHSIAQAYQLLEGRSDLNMVVIRDGQRYALAVAPEE